MYKSWKRLSWEWGIGDMQGGHKKEALRKSVMGMGHWGYTGGAIKIEALRVNVMGTSH